MTNELQLINAAKAGSAEAFADLVRSYRTRLLRFLLTRCASFADAEDVLQDTMIAAYRYLHSYDPRWRFSTWLYQIAIRNAQKIDPNVRAIVCSGYSNDPAMANYLEHGFCGIVSKPFKPAKLVQAIRKIEDSKNRPILAC